jgi:prepilin-type N-terminal cleavage/methylation domain-containing protein
VNNIFHRQKSQKGFTIIELLIIVVVLGILLAIVLPRMGTSKEQAKLVSCRSNLRNLQSALAFFYAKEDSYPDDLNALDVPGKMKLCPTGGTYIYTIENGSYKIECRLHGLIAQEDGIEAASGGGELPDYPLWDPAASYRRGEYIIYNGRVFQARYYAGPNQVPGELTSPWQEITDEWRNFNVYRGDDIVIYEGRQFKARNWTQNEKPGLLESPWQELTDQWRGFNVYEAGDEVFYRGQKYRAKWWSQNSQPGSSDAWELIH